MAKFVDGASLTGRGLIDICVESGTKVLASQPVDLGYAAEIKFHLDAPTRNVEMRFFCESEVSLSLESIEFRPA